MRERKEKPWAVLSPTAPSHLFSRTSSWLDGVLPGWRVGCVRRSLDYPLHCEPPPERDASKHTEWREL